MLEAGMSYEPLLKTHSNIQGKCRRVKYGSIINGIKT